LADGCGVRQTGRLAGVDNDTAARYSARAGASLPTLRRVGRAFSLTAKVPVDEKWSFVGKKQKNCDLKEPADDRKGNCWDQVALDADSRLVLELAVGPRTVEVTRSLLEGMKG
jgi:hypothetical protein